MALENLKNNIETEKKIIKEIFILNSQVENAERGSSKNISEIRILKHSMKSMIHQLRIINNPIPEILNSISGFRKLETLNHSESKSEKVKNLVKISYPIKNKRVSEQQIKTPDEKIVSVTLKKADKQKFLEELSLSELTIKRLKKERKTEIPKQEFFEFKRASLYSRISNMIFIGTSNSLRERAFFQRLNSHLRKANMPFLLTTYISVIFFSTLLSFFLGVIFFIFLMFFEIHFAYPFIASTTRTFIELMINSSVIIVVPVLTFFSLYFYPSVEAKSIESKINQELPFLTIHMSAIAGSSIEPTQIFTILSMSEEYPNIRKELKKIINQVNVYGFDLLTSLKNTAKETSSRKLSELLGGMAAAISEGGSLAEYLDKRAETLIFEYKLEREKHTKNAETFMNIYISIMIAAPMIMTLLLILMSVSGIGMGLSMDAITLIIVSVVSIINIIFLVFLHLNQPEY
ncbi:MAG: type II secretion system F family protein [Nanoarchaeota archaeon]|nr:type II secretion system F family protein [Nanoarchaeota archaeon]